jgi:hypothetical protein
MGDGVSDRLGGKEYQMTLLERLLFVLTMWLMGVTLLLEVFCGRSDRPKREEEREDAGA